MKSEFQALKIELKEEINASETRLTQKIANELDNKLISTENRLDQRIDKVEIELNTVEKRLSQRIDKVEAELHAVEKRLDQKIDRVASQLVQTQADIREIKETMATKEDVSRILIAIDRFARKAEAYDRQAVLHGHILTDHEKRLASLESNS